MSKMRQARKMQRERCWFCGKRTTWMTSVELCVPDVGKVRGCRRHPGVVGEAKIQEASDEVGQVCV